MEGNKDCMQRTIYLKNMICSCSIRMVKEYLERIGVAVEEVSLGKATIRYNEKKIAFDDIRVELKLLGLEIIENRDQQLVEKIKLAVIELIHHMNNVDSIARKKDYIVEKLGLSYTYLSRIFSAHEKITLEKYIILNKIERIKELIDQEEFTLSEIAFMMDYSSVQYLSNQFKHITGMSVSDYKHSNRSARIPVDAL